MLIQIHDPNENKPNVAKESTAIGIDLGTTHTLAAVVKNGKPILLTTKEGEIFFPSVVHHNHQEMRSTKRHMDMPLKDIKLGINALQAATIILSKVKKQAEEALSQPVEHAVITVPAYFNDTARQATKDAAKLAGLEVLRLINEPTAAALAYGLDANKTGKYMIYDFGGGTFDVSILSLNKGIFQVLATAGDGKLGGDDIDSAIAQYFGWQLSTGLQKAKEAKENLKEKCKENPSENPDESNNTGALTEDLLKEISWPFVQRTLSLCDQALQDAKLAVHDLAGIVLVGGSSKLSAVRASLEKHYDCPLFNELDPDKIVAYGAALQADQLTNGVSTLLLDVTPLSLGIETAGDLVEKIIPRNTPIPVSMAQDFTTQIDGQTSLKIHVLQGEREFVADCQSLATFILKGIPPMLAGAARIRVTFSLDADGLLTVSATEQISGVQQHVEVKPAYGMNPDDFAKLLLEAYTNGAIDIKKRQVAANRIKAEQILYQIKKALDKDAHLLDQTSLDKLHSHMNMLNQALEKKDTEHVSQLTDKLMELSQPFAEKRMEAAIKQKLQHQNLR